MVSGSDFKGVEIFKRATGECYGLENDNDEQSKREKRTDGPYIENGREMFEMP